MRLRVFLRVRLRVRLLLNLQLGQHARLAINVCLMVYNTCEEVLGAVTVSRLGFVPA